MNMVSTRDRLAADANELSHIETLLLQYPGVTPEESNRIAHFLRTGAPMDIGLLSSNHAAWEKAELFRRDHPKKFATTAREFAVMIIATALLVLGGIGLWHVTAD